MPLTQAADGLMHTLPGERRRSGTYSVGGPHRPPQQRPPQRHPLREPHRSGPPGIHRTNTPRACWSQSTPAASPTTPASVDLDFRPPGNLPADCTIEEWEAAVSVELDDGKVSGPTLDFLSGPIIGSAQADTLTGDRTDNIIADRGDDILIGNAGVDAFGYLLWLANTNGSDTITGYTLGTTQAESDRNSHLPGEGRRTHLLRRGQRFRPRHHRRAGQRHHSRDHAKGDSHRLTQLRQPEITVNDNGPSCSSTRSVERRRALRGAPTQGVAQDAESENAGTRCDPSSPQTLWFVIFSGTPFLYFWLEANIEAGTQFPEHRNGRCYNGTRPRRSGTAGPECCSHCPYTP